MGRKPDHPAADPTRTRLLAAALDVFSELGYAGASLRIIGGRARVNPAGVTYHFATKEQLWLAATQEISRPLLTIAMAAVAKRQPARATLRTLLGAMFDAFAADPRPARLMMWSALQAGQLDFDRTLDVFEPLIALAVTYFETAQRARELPADVDVPVVLPLVLGQFIYTFIAQPGQRRRFGVDVSDAKFGVRARTAMLDGAERLLGLDRSRRRTAK
ncbi:MAG TPA: TetR family transcriptional regulator [Kofleriaceae bacterium]